MNKVKFSAILAAGAALALSPTHVVGQPAARPVSMGTKVRHNAEGMEVTAVLPGHTAAALGLQVGDIVVELGGKPISPQSAEEYLEQLREGDQISLKAKRGSEVLELTARALAAPAGAPAPAAAEAGTKPASFGAQIQMSPEGPQIAALVPNRTAVAIGFKIGDIMLEAGGTPISQEVFDAYMKGKKPGDQVSFKVKRAGAVLELTGKALPVPEGAPAPTPLPQK